MDSIETDMSEMLITLTSDIVAAHVSNNTISVEQVPTLISTVYGALAGLGGLAALTLADPGATRMWSAPWTGILAFVLAAPILALVVRTLASSQPFRLPPPGWLLLAAGSAAIPLASAWLSPWRAPSLLQAALPVSAAALFLLLQDWLAAVPERNRLLQKWDKEVSTLPK